MPKPEVKPAADGRRAFAASPMLSHLSKADLTALVREARPRLYRAGEQLFERGDPGDGIFAIVSGEVRFVLVGPAGNEVVVRRMQDGDVFGELAALDGAARTATAIATAPVRALHISTKRFVTWLEDHPAAAVALLQHLAHRLRTTNDQLAEVGLLDVETRIARSVRRLFTEAGAAEPGQRLRINQKGLATELGVTRESVNKHLARLKARGVIDVDRGLVTLLQPDALDAVGRD